MHTAYVACAWLMLWDTAASRSRVCVHTANVSAAALLPPALSFSIELAFDTVHALIC